MRAGLDRVEEVGNFQEYAHRGGELRCSGQDDTESFFGGTAVGRLAFSSTIKGLRHAEDRFFGERAGSSCTSRSAERGPSKPEGQGSAAGEEDVKVCKCDERGQWRLGSMGDTVIGTRFLQW